MFKQILLFGLVTGYCVGQTLFWNVNQDGAAGASADSPVSTGFAANLVSAGRQYRALEPPKRSPPVGNRHRRLRTQKLLTPDDVCRIVVGNSDGSFQTSDDPRVIVFSVVDQANQETRIAVDRDLVLKYSSLLRDIGTFDGQAIRRLQDITGNDDVIHVLSDSPYFITLLGLLWQYDQNPTAYQNGQRFDIDPANVFGILHVANFLFSNNDLKSPDEWLPPTNDLGFFHALLNSCGPVIFDPLFSLQTKGSKGNLVLPLPYDIYHAALPFADASLVSVFFNVLENLNRVDALNGLDQRLLLMLLAPAQEQCALWRRLKALQDLHKKASQPLDGHDSETLRSLGERFIEWGNFQPNQPVLQGNIVVSSTELADNMQAIDAFFAQNPDKTLVVDFGNATEIGDMFIVPKKSIKRLIIVGEQITAVGDDFLYRCSGLTKLTLPQNLTRVGHNFLAGCSGLTQVNLPDTLTAVGHGFLWGCYGLTALTLPQSLTTVGHFFLKGCSGLTALIVSRVQEEILRDEIATIKSRNSLLSVTIKPEARQQAVH